MSDDSSIPHDLGNEPLDLRDSASAKDVFWRSIGLDLPFREKHDPVGHGFG